MAQSFGGRKLWCIAAQKYFGRKKIGGSTALYSKSVIRIKILDDKSLVDWL